jgi:hypothetical protein
MFSICRQAKKTHGLTGIIGFRKSSTFIKRNLRHLTSDNCECGMNKYAYLFKCPAILNGRDGLKNVRIKHIILFR